MQSFGFVHLYASQATELLSATFWIKRILKFQNKIMEINRFLRRATIVRIGKHLINLKLPLCSQAWVYKLLQWKQVKMWNSHSQKVFSLPHTWIRDRNTQFWACNKVFISVLLGKNSTEWLSKLLDSERS